MKGIVLSGGHGTRLHPVTLAVSKQLLPVYDKPMVHYPLSTLMLAGIQDFLLITNAEYMDSYRRLLGDGSQLGIQIEYASQDRPRGLADAFRVGRRFVGGDDVALVLGDNIFHGQGLAKTVQEAAAANQGATVFAYPVRDPSRYGVITLDGHGKPQAIEEKPQAPRSNLAVTGLYMYDNSVLDIAAKLEPSARGELEITDVNRKFLHNKRLRCVQLGRGMAWLDMGTHESLLQASDYIATLERRQGLKVACLEEIAFRMGFIDSGALAALADAAPTAEYGNYLRSVMEAH